MVINTILTLAGVAAVASVVNLFMRKPTINKVASMNIQLPGNLPIMTLSTKKGTTMNFLIDSGSNISHICSNYFKDLDAEVLGTYEDGKVSSLGAVNTGITMCEAELLDIFGNNYIVHLSVSEQLIEVSKDIEANTGVKIHGLLGTDFLKDYGCVIDFDSFEIYSRK